MTKAGVITVSDKGSKGQRVDKSGPAIKKFVEEKMDARVTSMIIVPDEQELIEKTLLYYADVLKLDLVFTTGGTGFAPRDVTPEATMNVVDKPTPGISEVIRSKSLGITPKAMLSRGTSGIRKSTLIINLPGSPRGATESVSFILDALPHGIDILKEEAKECARKD
ncbi:MogA/MoaB family molybdenum cofactor biosynthesis protein [Isachenkonia alkalipeptolytica]|uniref:MogA/MoaB family molybdenum cofactor biosynthesis protein n=1 Tax=Isachenkonia alkalipeptolytica TaxID=2565777 RepID=A0AA43XLD1_9CLOT|nr:MogA/MoaB family molybdenum cofactor biosynthesis protein [Isachenkonia alkalipeptolytica]NBG88973.1 MogA/MoaB family molybdenum cofactor biosynthesis protein [Isachenkonia alkalipeptolytica]